MDISFLRDVVVNGERKFLGELDDKVVEYVLGVNSVLVIIGFSNGEVGVCDVSLGSRVDIKLNEIEIVEFVNG